jgi:hypothetical protein
LNHFLSTLLCRKDWIPGVEEIKALINESMLKINNISFIIYLFTHSINIYWATNSSHQICVQAIYYLSTELQN